MDCKPSGHKVEVVPVVLEPHPSATTLSIVRVYGYTVCVKTDDWRGVSKAAYIPPDTLVPVGRMAFAFLKTGSTFYNATCEKVQAHATGEVYCRVTAKRLRGVVSYGLLVPAPDGAEVGDDVAESLGAIHYNAPDVGDVKGEACAGPNLVSPKYDVESFQRHASRVFCPGELVAVTEKIHGANGRWVYHDGRFYAGSRTEWKIESDTNQWWRAFHATPDFDVMLRRLPSIIVYGEVYGCVQNLRYGCAQGEVRIGVFDLLDKGGWISYCSARDWSPNLPWVPEVAEIPFDMETITSLADGPSLVPGANHYREGVVVKPFHGERHDDKIGRVQLKLISPAFLEKCK